MQISCAVSFGLRLLEELISKLEGCPAAMAPIGNNDGGISKVCLNFSPRSGIPKNRYPRFWFTMASCKAIPTKAASIVQYGDGKSLSEFRFA